ncbi:hypothetical protein QOT17_006102 [Balamuthia mandrillaris]
MQPQTVKKGLLLSGLLMFFSGCVLALIPHDVIPSYRPLVTFHLEQVTNGALLLGLAAAVDEMHLGSGLWTLFFVLANVGTWLNGLTFLVCAFTASAIPIAPIMSSQGNLKENAYTPALVQTLLLCVLAFLPALVLAMVGVIRGPPPKPKRQ